MRWTDYGKHASNEEYRDTERVDHRIATDRVARQRRRFKWFTVCRSSEYTATETQCIYKLSAPRVPRRSRTGCVSERATQ